MESYVKLFIRSSLIWLGTGVVLGVVMALFPFHAMVLRPAHAHANLLGFVSMMIFGVAYHVLPRFTGNPLHSGRLAFAHLVVANGGLALFVGGLVVRGLFGAGGVLVPGGALLSGAGAGLFIWNIWRTLDGTPVTARPELVRLAVRGRAT
jgi:cytochrome c oxidase cbb3-type subunit 1